MGDPWILGLGGNHHNGSACLLKGDRIVAAIQEERLSGYKNSGLSFDSQSLAIRYCLDAAGITAADLDAVVTSPTGWSREPRALVVDNPALEPIRNRTLMLTVPHHLAHAIGAFAVSGFERAVILVVDGLGAHYCDLTTDEREAVRSGFVDGSEVHSVYEGSGCRMRPLAKFLIDHGRWRCFPPQPGTERLAMPNPVPPPDVVPGARSGMRRFHGLGDMYSAVAEQVFGDRAGGPGMLMGLAAYGVPRTPVEEFFAFKDGHFLFRDGVPGRFLHDERYPTRMQEYRDLAASVQRAFEKGMLHLAAYAATLSSSRNLVLAGGCALNGVANERLLRESTFERLFVIPPAEDSGVAVGAAYWGYWQLCQAPSRFRMTRDSFGVAYSDSDVVDAARDCPFVEEIAVDDPLDACVDYIVDGKIVGFFDGGSELGPRALGQRSIVCDPRRADARQFLNERVKFREDFRPFAPAILEEEVPEWFETGGFPDASEFMLRVMRFRPTVRDRVPAVAHQDGTGRLQTLTAQANGRFYQLVRRMFERTGVPILVNTSLNVKGEPIVETPTDALRCLLFTEIDVCLVENRLFRRRPTAWTALDMEPRLAVEIHSGFGEVRLVRSTPWGQLQATAQADSKFGRFCTSLVALVEKGGTALQLASAIPQVDPSYAGWKPEHVLAVLCRQGWIRLVPPGSRRTPLS